MPAGLRPFVCLPSPKMSVNESPESTRVSREPRLVGKSLSSHSLSSSADFGAWRPRPPSQVIRPLQPAIRRLLSMVLATPVGEQRPLKLALPLRQEDTCAKPKVLVLRPELEV